MKRFSVMGFDFRGPATCPADPRYPNGVDLDRRIEGEDGCKADLPYPAPGCLNWLVACSVCGANVVVTAAGRRDDPRSVVVICRKNKLDA